MPIGRSGRIRQISLIALLFAVAAPAHGQGTFIDQLFERHVRVKSAIGPPGVLHLLYERKADPQAPPGSCYRRHVAGKGWLPEEYLHGGHRCVAFLGDALYVFRRTNYSVYRTKDWTAPAIFPTEAEKGTFSFSAQQPPAPQGGEKVNVPFSAPGSEWQTNAWPLKWPPAAACTVGEEIWVFGAEATDTGGGCLRAARLRPRAPEAADRGPHVVGQPLLTAAPPSDFSVLAEGAAVRVFWLLPAPGREGNGLWHAPFDGNAWGAPNPVALPYPNSDYAAARHEGATWLICKVRGRRIAASRPLLAMALADGAWGEPSPIPAAEDPRWLDSTVDIDAASFEGSLYVFRACMNRVVAHRWSVGQWGEPETLLELSPWPTYLFWWLVANMAASLVLLPAVAWAALRVRARPRPRVRAFGAEVPLASWARRVAAQLVDTLVGLLLATGVLRWLETGAGNAAPGSESILATVGVCSSVFFAYFALSEGLTGQSFGKLLLHIAVVASDGGRPSLRSIVVRNLLRPWPFLVPTAYLVGSLVLLLSPTNQRLGDFLAGTLVVDLPPPAPSPWVSGGEGE
ncbi:MAG: RDD family protein [Planctomycetes bacterium]|nr:RDD family protein [Planctomycetota bacterium]